MNRIFAFIKKEVVLCVASVLAILSMFVIPPDISYIDYLDLRTLSLLFCLMTVMAGFQSLGMFEWIAKNMLKKAGNLRQLMMILVFLCFFFSMFITNDVALITFVPLTLSVISMLKDQNKEKWLIVIVVMQTIAANLGSMLTPIGNPQNLYLYGRSGLSMGAFLQIMLPYTVISFALLSVWILLYSRKNNIPLQAALSQSDQPFDGKKLILYSILFVLSLLSVAHITDYRIVLCMTIILVLFFHKDVLKKVDYTLLLTFAAFFIFIGNMGRIPAFASLLQTIVAKEEVLTAIFTSQFISNVPAALLLSGFTDAHKALIIGTNLGGLGTLIASMASLISFKYIVSHDSAKKGIYFRLFTVSNIIFLIILTGVYLLLR